MTFCLVGKFLLMAYLATRTLQNVLPRPLHHSRTWNFRFHVSFANAINDISGNGTLESFSHVWGKFHFKNSSSALFPLPSYLRALILLAFVLMHVGLSCLIQCKMALKSTKTTGERNLS